MSKLHDIVPADDDRPLLRAQDTDLVDGAQTRRSQINGHIQHVLDIINSLERGETRDPQAALNDLADLTTGGGQAWLEDIQALHGTLVYARSNRFKLQETMQQLADLKQALAKADTNHPLVKKIDQVLREYHAMDFDMELVVNIENANNGMDKSTAFAILAALQGRPVSGRAAPKVAYWLRHAADTVKSTDFDEMIGPETR